MPEFDFLLTIDLFKKSLVEQQTVVKNFWEKARTLLQDSGIELRPLPESWVTLRHNYFSVLFIALFFVMKIPPQRLRFYARLNHCLRSWVTACDNLLDQELKEMILTDLPGQAYTFKSVHTLLLTDRVFFSFLLDAVRSGTLSQEEMERLLPLSLSAITASGREEAEEEAGIAADLSPKKLLQQVHTAKTGRLFTSPLFAPLALGDIHIKDPQVADIHQGLLEFGLGCQILDDLSDLGMDLMDSKYNYVAALIRHGGDLGEKNRLSKLRAGKADPLVKNDFKLYQKFPVASAIAMQTAVSKLKHALMLLSRAGLPFNAMNREAFIRILIKLFRHPGALMNVRGR